MSGARPKASGAAARAHRRKLLALQRRIFQSLQREADALLGEMPEAIRHYQARYDREFRAACRRRPVRASKDDLIRAIRAADVSFVADYHSFRQAQRTALRLIREAVRPGERWFIGLELIPSRFQTALDLFQEGRINLETFHQTINYKEEWGFPWNHYAPIFDWAREHDVRLIAMNRPREILWNSASLRRAQRDSDLHERDQWASGMITDLMAAERAAGRQTAKIIVLYGELHLAERHMPAQLARVSQAFLGKPLKAICVHQNNDMLYWKLAREGREHNNVFRITRHAWCVLSSTPWAKLQSLVSWAEGGLPTGDIDSDFEDDYYEGVDDTETDYLAAMQTYGETIAEFLDIAAPAYSDLTIRTIREADFLEDMSGEHEFHFSRRELDLIRFHVEANQRLYIPRAGIAYLGSPSENSAAELAAIHLQRACTRSQDFFVPEQDDFFRLALESTFGFFGSLIINPRRKCDLLGDHARRLRQLRGTGHSLEIESRRLTLAVLRAEERLLRGAPFRVPGLSDAMSHTRLAPAAMMAARHVGRILGKRVHQALLSGAVTPDMVHNHCLVRAKKSARHEDHYLALVRAAAASRLAPNKNDML